MEANPSIAERARTMLAGHLPGQVHLAGRPQPFTVPHGTDEQGRPLLLVPDRVGLLAGRAGVIGTLTVDDVAPVPDAPRYGRAHLSGVLAPVDPARVRAAATAFADTNPHPDLLDIGYGQELWCVEVGTVWLDSGTAQHSVDTPTYLAATPDPLCRDEFDLVADLREHHPEFVDRLVACVSADARPTLRGAPTVVRVDRHGVLLDAGDAKSYVRISLPRDVSGPEDFAAALHPLFCDRCYADPHEMARYGFVRC